MKTISASFAIGLLFGLGLTISGMINPSKIINFLDLAGSWDPSLALVMVGALVVTFVGYRLVLARGRPLLAQDLNLPTSRALDFRLLMGAALFGVGWGLAGLCPGPAITLAFIGGREALIFLGAMILGMAAFAVVERFRG